MMDRRPFQSNSRASHDMRNERPPEGNGQHTGMLAAFFPGQKAALAEQLNQGFGGGEDRWRSMMSKTYAPIRNAASFRYGTFGGGGGGGNGGGGHVMTVNDGPSFTVSGQAPLSPEMLAMIRDNLTKQGM